MRRWGWGEDGVRLHTCGAWTLMAPRIAQLSQHSQAEPLSWQHGPSALAVQHLANSPINPAWYNISVSRVCAQGARQSHLVRRVAGSARGALTHEGRRRAARGRADATGRVNRRPPPGAGPFPQRQRRSSGGAGGGARRRQRPPRAAVCGYQPPPPPRTSASQMGLMPHRSWRVGPTE